LNTNSTMGTIIYFAFIFAVFYFILIRPQQKRAKQHKELVSTLNVNDEVVTAGGIFGTVTRVKDSTVWLKIADKVEVEILKTSISSRKPEKKE